MIKILSKKTVYLFTGAIVLAAAIVIGKTKIVPMDPQRTLSVGVDKDELLSQPGNPTLEKSKTSGSRAASPKKSSAQDMADLKSHQTNLSQEVNGLKSELNALRGQALEPKDSGDLERDAELNLMDEEEKNFEHVQAQIEIIENLLADEVADAEWSNAATDSINDAVNEINSGDDSTFSDSDIDIDCRTTMCRIGLSLNSPAQPSAIRRVQEINPWNGEMLFMIDDIESGEATVYIAREDQRLPSSSFNN